MLLSQSVYPKRIFNPESPEDLKVFENFTNQLAWHGPCPFYLEWPYEEIPAMIKDKILQKHLGQIIKNTKKKPK